MARAYNSNSFGNTVIIDHGPSSSGNGNVFTLYAHGNSLSVQQGDVVTVGQNVMLSGNSGLSDGPHLHYEVIVTTSTPFQGTFFNNFDQRYAPSALPGLLGQ